MDSEQSPEKKPLSDTDYDVISISSIPLDDKCEKLLPDDYECNLVISDCRGEECVGGEECELRGGCGEGAGAGGGGDCSGCSGSGGCGGCDEDSEDNVGGSGGVVGVAAGIGIDMAVGGQNNNDCDNNKKTNKKKNAKTTKKNNKTKNKNYKVTVVQPTKDMSARKGRKNSREPEIRDTNLVLSLFVLFCFNLPFGLLATMFSLMAGSAFKDGKKKKAKCHSRTSMVISLLGIATTASLVMCVIFFLAINEQSQGY